LLLFALLIIAILTGWGIFTLLYSLHLPSTSTFALPLTWPLLHFRPSLCKCLLIFQWGFCLGILSVNTLCLNQSNPLHYTFSSFSLYPVLFNSFQCVLLCLVLTQM
jgi:hypothetical protein